MHRRIWLSMLCGSICFLGCRSRSDLVEAELRTKDRQLREIKTELDHTRIINQSLEQQLFSPPSESSVPVVRDSRTLTSGARTLQLGSGTGGIDQDGIPGDDALVLILIPKDEDGHAVKVIGVLRVHAQEIAPEGIKSSLGSWELSTTQLRPLWQQGLLSTGFHIKFGLTQPPRFEKVRITAQLALPDGRVLETDKDVRVHPAQEGSPLLPTPENLLPIPEPIPSGPILSHRRAELRKPRAGRGEE